MFTERIITQPLTDHAVLIRPCEDNQEREPLDAAIYRIARLFRALKTGLEDLKMFYEELRPELLPSHLSSSTAQSRTFKEQKINTSTPATKTPRDHFDFPFAFPHWKMFVRDGIQWKLEYTNRLSAKYLEKTVFVAKASSSQGDRMVVVKFCKSYGYKGHTILSDLGLAPKLFYCEKLECLRRYAIVMEYIENAHTAEYIRPNENGKKGLRLAIEALHKKNLVFGDLRRPNILVCDEGDRIYLIDFDWCGEYGIATYPTHIRLNDTQDWGMPWSRGVNRGSKIEKKHDLELIELI
jgi:hypothetical protein